MLPIPSIHQRDAAQHIRAVRIWAAIFIVGLVLSGITAFPLVTETTWLVRASTAFAGQAHWPTLHTCLIRVAAALADTDGRYPFLAYGTDWLAFGHLVIAVAFIGLFLDPVRNKWLVTFGLIACAGVLPLALIAGAIRHIPFFWRLVDCSFGVLGCVLLLLCGKHVRLAETERGIAR